MIMKDTPEFIKALNELKHVTGLSFDITVDTAEEMEQAISQIHLLCSAYRSKYDREYFLQELLKGQAVSHDTVILAEKFHIDPHETRILYLLETSSPADELVMEILKNLFPAGNKTYLIPTGQKQIVILHTLSKGFSQDTINQMAYTISDTLNMEALISVKISCSRVINHLDEIPSAFQDSCMAMKIGCIFNADQTVYHCGSLGIGQLIYGLPKPLCESFLSEIFGEAVPYTLNDDIMHTVNVFFKNNLNIAVTARQLHMHRNTLIYRLEQIEKTTGLDIRIFEEAILFKIAAMVISYLQTEGSESK